ncbi:helix-turn-helix domain-containing protein [Chryseobacterium polytrichastri]|uniref:HTH araC/xylS-type domain-containing protein n=1 Tax=Chryseobacterium polytrichastri TaxID=1302687 RepID=A0A1M6XPQ7_9FLAO|nr:AraC family transcriptional regulator [Chryseobacterium polytrichastri]SHL07992.1 hypothetical protein SAMN05444267_101182 [Chryseobacterium polytrichastri]
MKQKFYLLFIFFSFHITFAQSTPAETEISNKLKKISLTTNIDLKEKEASLLQLKAQSENLDYKLGILISGDYLMKLYLGQGKNKEVIKLGDQLKIVAKNEKDTKGYISNIYSKNAIALGYLGLADASLKDLKKALNYVEEVKDRSTKFYLLSKFYQDMGLQYNLKRFENKKLGDSLVYTYNKSIEMAKQINDNSEAISKDVKYDMVGFSYMRLGMFYLEQSENIKGGLAIAEKYLLKGLGIYQDKKYSLPPSNKIMILNQVSWLYMEKKEYQKSIDYAIRALELEKQFREPEHRVESFEFLATSYLELGEKEKSKFYMTEYSILKDSIAYGNRTDANETITKMVSEVDNEHKESSNKQLIIIGFLALIATITAFFIWRRNNKKLRKNYEHIIEKLRHEPIPNKIQVSNTNNTNRNTISSETEERILNQLEVFENSEGFLRKDLNISMLSIELNTNAKYLSEIIKNKKSHSFSSYSNSLKINYIVHKLYNEAKYRSYKISHLAEICGYSSPQVFFVAFKKINGVTPSYFIQSLNEDKI